VIPAITASPASPASSAIPAIPASSAIPASPASSAIPAKITNQILNELYQIRSEAGIRKHISTGQVKMIFRYYADVTSPILKILRRK
jgi:hypothetical protein